MIDKDEKKKDDPTTDNPMKARDRIWETGLSDSTIRFEEVEIEDDTDEEK